MSVQEELYKNRFSGKEAARQKVWQAIVLHLQRKVLKGLKHDTVLDVGSGYGEFINNFDSTQRFALDLNPNSASMTSDEVKFLNINASDVGKHIDKSSIDLVFSSNFFEHLSSKNELSSVVQELWNVLKPGGHILIMGPNIRLLAGQYWDFYDHHIPLSDKSATELLKAHGFEIIKSHSRFLPYTMSNKKPPPRFLVGIYLTFPFFWKIAGKQFLILAQKGQGVKDEH